jgi:hypothetical protein
MSADSQLNGKTFSGLVTGPVVEPGAYSIQIANQLRF